MNENNHQYLDIEHSIKASQPLMETKLSGIMAKQCCICNRRVAKDRYMPLDQLLPKLIRYIEKSYPRVKYMPRSDAIVCLSDLRGIVQTRLSELVEEDMSQHHKLQDDAMKNMGIFETTEETWQDQFQQEKTSIGDKASDMVAKWGGSWNFIGVLSICLVAWIGINCAIDSIDAIPMNAWDPYPYIFLTFILSMIQTFQAPFIMMTQNRQDARDREEREVQSRHINTKIDHLISLQWKRLLEIQELQMFMFQVIQLSSTIGSEIQESVDLKGSRFVVECVADPFLEYLFRIYFKMPLKSDNLLFTRWHSDNSNFSGNIHNIKLNRNGINLESLTFDLKFNVDDATLDDVFSGDHTISLRNDFDLRNMVMTGRILEIQGLTIIQNFSYINGEFPERYNMSFSESRTERISDFWKEPLMALRITYSPSMEFAAIIIEPNERLEDLSLYFNSLSSKSSDLYYQSCYLKDSSESFLEEQYDAIIKSLLGPMPPVDPWKSVKKNKLSINFDTYPKKKRSSLEVHQIPPATLLHDDNISVIHIFYCQQPFTCSFEIIIPDTRLLLMGLSNSNQLRKSKIKELKDSLKNSEIDFSKLEESFLPTKENWHAFSINNEIHSKLLHSQIKSKSKTFSRHHDIDLKNSRLSDNSGLSFVGNDIKRSKSAQHISNIYSSGSYIPFPIELFIKEINQSPTPQFLSWNSCPKLEIHPPKYNFKKRKKRIWKLEKLLNHLEDQSSIFICPFCEADYYR